MTLAYTLRSTSVMLVEVRVSSAYSIKVCLFAVRLILWKVLMPISIGQIAFSTTATGLGLTLNGNGAGGSNSIFSAAILSLSRVALLTPCSID